MTTKDEALQTETNYALLQAKSQLEGIIEMVTALKQAHDNEDEARQAIQEDPLSVGVRSGWRSPGSKDTFTNEEFKILLCTGGPAVQLIGELNEHNEPESVVIQYQDWGTPWTNYPLTTEEESQVLAYCQEFYFAD